MQLTCQKKSKAADKEHRIPTVICLKATDHALQAGARLSLAHFIREHPVKRLAKTEVRYYLEKGQVDDELFGRGQLRRAAIFDKATKQTRLEIVGESAHCLHVRSDRGSLGWTQWFPLYSALPTAGSFHWDEPHKMWDNDRLATNHSGLSSLMSTLVLLTNLGRCPYGSHAMQQQISQCAKTYFSQATTECEYFLYFYENLRMSFPDTAPRPVLYVMEKSRLRFKVHSTIRV